MSDFEIAKRQFREYYDSNIELLRDAETSNPSPKRSRGPAIVYDPTRRLANQGQGRVHKQVQRKYRPLLANTRTRYTIKDHNRRPHRHSGYQFVRA